MPFPSSKAAKNLRRFGSKNKKQSSLHPPIGAYNKKVKLKGVEGKKTVYNYLV